MKPNAYVMLLQCTPSGLSTQHQTDIATLEQDIATLQALIDNVESDVSLGFMTPTTGLTLISGYLKTSEIYGVRLKS